MDNYHKLRRTVERQAERMQKADRERPTMLAQTAFLGVLAFLLVLPIVAGAYLGRWLDQLSRGYSVSWTVSLILIGVLVGVLNVYWFVKER